MSIRFCWFLPLLLAGCGGVEEYPRWSKIELAFERPETSAMGVTFTSPDGENYLVPGFHNGSAWVFRFSADRNGSWSWRTQSSEPPQNGTFHVIDPADDAPDFYRWGRLEYVGNRYLKFREGPYWLKAGADEPENLLGDAFGRDNWEAKKRQIDYLASAGINSVYIMTHNLEGDRRDVWPWLGDTEERAKGNPERFDHERLERWRDLFEYIQDRGLVIQLVLEDDSAWTGYTYGSYYREIIARFGYLPAIYFNFCEEYNESHSLEEALDRMKLLASLDPYNHPRAIHNVNLPVAAYIDDESAVQVASIQTNPSKPATLNQLAIDWFEAPLARQKRPLVVSFDEARPPEDQRSWWAVFLGGGVWEGILKVENDYSEFETEWRRLSLARQFMERLPFHEMFPANHVVATGEAFCLAEPPEVYALYLPGGGSIELDLPKGNGYRASWFDPRGEQTVDPVDVAGGRVKLTAPSDADWAVRIDRTSGDVAAPVTAASAKLVSIRNEPVEVHLAVLPGATPGLRREVVKQPAHGTLTGAGADRTYTPRSGFTGRDEFQWRALGDTGSSNTATVRITCNATGVNTAPRAAVQTARTEAGRSVTLILRYSDVDGPGPYRIRIHRQPSNGSLTGIDNDVTYTPNTGFSGTDDFEWSVSDGQSRSNRATVKINVT